MRVLDVCVCVSTHVYDFLKERAVWYPKMNFSNQETCQMFRENVKFCVQ